MKYIITHSRWDTPDETYEFHAKSNKEAVRKLVNFRRRTSTWDDYDLDRIIGCKHCRGFKTKRIAIFNANKPNEGRRQLTVF